MRKLNQDQERKALAKAIEQVNRFVQIDGPVEILKDDILGASFDDLHRFYELNLEQFDNFSEPLRMSIKRIGRI